MAIIGTLLRRARARHDGDKGGAARPASRWLPIAAISFVLLALIVLAVAPVIVFQRFDATLREVEAGIMPARTLTIRLAVASERQVAATHAFVLSGDPAYRHRFEEARSVQAEAIERLQQVLPAIDPGAAARLEHVRGLASTWHTELAGLRQEITAGDYLEMLPRLEALQDSLLAAVAALESEVARASAARLEETERLLGTQTLLSFGLGMLAFLAAMIVGWFARRQWQLAVAIERALAEENRLREESDTARKELVRVTESRARLMRGFGHDVKNPLGAADGYLRLLADGILGELTEQQRLAIDRASRSIGGALNLVDDLVDLARAETGKLEIARVPTDLREVVREAADEYRAQAEAKNLDLSMVVPEQFPLVPTDGRRVRQVLGNLLSNAVKYTGEGSVTVRLRLQDRRRSGGPRRWVEIDVEDTGPGIPETQRHLLFREFSRLAPGEAVGAGLGLAISHRVATALGGRITVESKVGRGSTFTLVLPLRRSTDLRAA